MTDNLHPVDELFSVRCAIAKLEKREKELRIMILELPAVERIGRDAEAAVTVTARRSLDTKLVTEEMGEEWVAARSKTSDVTTLKIREL